jgi:hypothetical protein
MVSLEEVWDVWESLRSQQGGKYGRKEGEGRKEHRGRKEGRKEGGGREVKEGGGREEGR